MKCNIDARGKRTRLLAGFVTVFAGILALLLLAACAGLGMPLLTSLEKRSIERDASREKNDFFLSHTQKSGGDQCKLLAIGLWQRHSLRAWYDQALSQPQSGGGELSCWRGIGV